MCFGHWCECTRPAGSGLHEDFERKQDLTLLEFKRIHLPIMNDVEAETVSGDDKTLTFKAVKDGVTREYMISYGSVQTVGSNNKVANGYNVITDGRDELSASGMNAIVEIKAGGSAVIKNCSGINIIYLNSGSSLTVKGDCTARVIVRSGAPAISIENGGKLANTGNDLAGAVITNNVLAEINGSNIGTVQATFTGWPANVLPANSRVNNITINCAATTQIVNQAQINKFQNLSNVNLTLTGVSGFIGGMEDKRRKNLAVCRSICIFAASNPRNERKQGYEVPDRNTVV